MDNNQNQPRKSFQLTKPMIIGILAAIVAVIVIIVIAVNAGNKNDTPSTPSKPSFQTTGKADPSAPLQPPKAGYVWITFADWDGSVLQNVEVKKGEIPVYTGATPSRAGDEEFTYEFTGWSETLAPATQDHTYTATYNAVSRLPAWDGSVASAFAGGSGTASDPYQISNGAELAYLAKQINNGNTSINHANAYFILTSDINLNHQEWNPIGSGISIQGTADENCVFKGFFDGDGSKILNMKISTPHRSYYQYFGLFGSVSGTVQDVTLENCNITLETVNAQNFTTGGLCGKTVGGTLEDCKVSGTVRSSYLTGGIVGEATEATVRACVAEASVAGNVSVGGLVGYADKCAIIDSVSEGSVLDKLMFNTDHYCGGLIGRCRETGVVRCRSSSSLKTVPYNDTPVYHWQAGGLIGQAEYGSSVSLSCADGEVYINSDVQGGFGGLIGTVSSAPYMQTQVVNCYAQGNVKTASNLRISAWIGGCVGIVGANSGVSNCYASGNVSSVSGTTFSIGGFAGKIEGAVTNCLAYGNVSAVDSVSTAPCVDAFGDDNYVGSTMTNCYHAEYQVLNGEGGIHMSGIAVLLEDLNTAAFYQSQLLWGDEWNLNELDVGNNKFPTLK